MSLAAVRVAGQALVAGLVLSGLVLSGCAVLDASAAPPSAAPAPQRLTLAVENLGTGPVRPDAEITVRAAGGALTLVTLSGDEGALRGTIARRSGSVWRYAGGLRPGATYTLVTRAVGADGRQLVDEHTFTTVAAKQLLRATVTPESGAEVGIGQPIKVEFSAPVTNRAEVERHLRVQSSRPTVGAWHWMSPTEARYRPQEYWPAHTTVSVSADLAGVDAGGGVWGEQDAAADFTIGRAMRSVVDLAALTMNVYEDGELLRTIPITGGKRGFTTRSGTKVVIGKEYHKVMDALSIGIPRSSPEYYRLDVYYALRVTSSGEFVHAAPWSSWAHGRANASHGCVGMSTSNGRWFYDRTILGDPIEMTGTSKEMELSNGFGDWNLSWSEWLAGSALQ